MSCLILKNDMLKGRRDSPVHLSHDEHVQRLDYIKSLCRSKTMKEELKKVSKVISTVLLPNYAFSCAFPLLSVLHKPSHELYVKYS